MANKKLLETKIEEFGELARDVPLESYSYINIGGTADFVFVPDSLESLTDSMELFNKFNVPHFVIGLGANTYFGDVTGAVLIDLKNLDDIAVSDSDDGAKLVTAGAGVVLDSHALAYPADKDVVKTMINKDDSRRKKDLIQILIENPGYKNFERFIDLPGQVGGSIFGNSSINENPIGKILTQVSYMTKKGQIWTVDIDYSEHFDYRWSGFQGVNSDRGKKPATKPGSIIVEAVFRLDKDPDLEAYPIAVNQAYSRGDSLPRNDSRTIGSVWKRRLPDVYIGSDNGVYDILDAVKFYVSKSGTAENNSPTEVGGVYMSPRNPLILHNDGSGTIDDFEKLMGYVEGWVKNRFDIQLTREIRKIDYQGKFTCRQT